MSLPMACSTCKLNPSFWIPTEQLPLALEAGLHGGLQEVLEAWLKMLEAWLLVLGVPDWMLNDISDVPRSGLGARSQRI